MTGCTVISGQVKLMASFGRLFMICRVISGQVKLMASFGRQFTSSRVRSFQAYDRKLNKKRPAMGLLHDK